ncbi:hypothetical protein BLNAU_11095 [Blattamonas nauphoetae]|uniref:Sarcosine oxidase subunit gamma n=1 Tax=Blattamonas nauphoetae TaxID=2049346 RepID=A0ABQ9XNM2_9EUKA|nr:hypothetical protein BLNAU_11095 [Blattamonas nauphoetae]
MEMLKTLLLWCSRKVHLALVKADLIPQLIITLNPQSLPFAEAVDIHTSLLSSIANSVWLSTPEGLGQVGLEDYDEQQTVHETVLQQVLLPSEKAIQLFSDATHRTSPNISILSTNNGFCPEYAISLDGRYSLILLRRNSRTAFLWKALQRWMAGWIVTIAGEESQ